jgi:hypothetical protein
LLKQDMLGGDLSFPWREWRQGGLPDFLTFPQAAQSGRKKQLCAHVQRFLENPTDEETREQLRKSISHVKASIGKEVKSVPFDEPCLGIIGMWRLGGGANPHFALALGEIMLYLNQPELAWSAYQRAIRESPRFSNDETLRTKLVEHCQRRQREFHFKDTNEREAAFAAELQIGLDYQQAYQKYEEEQLAAGKALDDSHFYDAFESRHGPIATPVGRADFAKVIEDTSWPEHGPIVLGTGVGAALGAIVVLLLARWKTQAAGVAKAGS